MIVHFEEGRKAQNEISEDALDVERMLGEGGDQIVSNRRYPNPTEEEPRERVTERRNP